MQNPWEIDWSKPQPAQSATGGGLEVVPLPEKPKTPAAQTPAQARKDELEVMELEQKLAKGGEKTGDDLKTALGDVGNVIKAARRAKDRSKGWFMTGFLSGLGGMTPEGVSLRGDLDIIGSNVAFDRLQKMRADSPTGGALGSITEKELQLLQNSAAALQPGQSDVDFQRNMDSIIQRYSDIYTRLGGNPADLEGGAAASKAEEKKDDQAPGAGPRVETREPIDPNGTGDIGFNAPPPKDPLSPEQQAAYDLFWKTNPQATADQLRAFGASIGVNVENADDIIKARDAGAGVQPGENAVPGLTGEEQAVVDQNLSGTGESAVRGAGDAVSLGAGNKIIAGLDTMIGDRSYDSNLRIQNEIDRLAAEENPLAYHGGQFAGGLVLPSFGANNLGQLARLGAAYGAAYGAGSSDSIADVPGNALTGGSTGAVLGFALPAGVNVLGRLGSLARNPMGRQVLPEQTALAQAAADEGVTISRPIVDPAARNRMAYLESTPGGARPVQESLDRTLTGIEDRAAALAPEGTPQERGLMGQRAQGAMTRDLERQRAAAGGLYDRARALAGDAPVHGREIVQELDTQIQQLQRNPNTNRALIDYLTEVRGDFINDAGQLVPKSVEDIRNIRTNLAGEINRRNLTRTNAERIISRAMDRGRRDIERDMLDAGPNGRAASELYREADVRWRLAKRDEKQIVERIVGPADNPISGKDAMSRAMAWLNSGAEGRTNAARFWEKLNPQEQRDFAATVASTYGRRSPDEPFSPAQFIAATREIPTSSRVLLFGEEGARSIANLRALSAAYQQTARSLNNSRSGMVQNWAKFLSGFAKGGTIGTVAGAAVGGLPGGLAGGAALSGLEIAMQRMSARSLMSPDMSRWLAAAPRMATPGAIRTHIDRLQNIAAKESGIAAEVTGLRQALLNAVNDNAAVQRVAADSADADGDGNE